MDGNSLLFVWFLGWRLGNSGQPPDFLNWESHMVDLLSVWSFLRWKTLSSFQAALWDRCAYGSRVALLRSQSSCSEGFVYALLTLCSSFHTASIVIRWAPLTCLLCVVRCESHQSSLKHISEATTHICSLLSNQKHFFDSRGNKSLKPHRSSGGPLPVRYTVRSYQYLYDIDTKPLSTACLNKNMSYSTLASSRWFWISNLRRRSHILVRLWWHYDVLPYGMQSFRQHEYSTGIRTRAATVPYRTGRKYGVWK